MDRKGFGNTLQIVLIGGTRTGQKDYCLYDYSWIFSLA